MDVKEDDNAGNIKAFLQVRTNIGGDLKLSCKRKLFQKGTVTDNRIKDGDRVIVVAHNAAVKTEVDWF